MASPMFLVILSSLVLSALCNTSFSYLQEGMVIKTKSGVYDCVDFYKQPAFQHPLLKNLTSKDKPNLAELQKQRVSDFGLKDGGCPLGTVPILRVNPNSGGNQSNYPDCVAVVHTVDTTRKYFGIDASVGLPKPRVQYTQWSAGRLKLINGNENLEAGYMVNPDLFKDYEAHLYAKFSNGAKGCINLQCPGFVQVATDAPLGVIPAAYSEAGGVQRYWHLTISKHEDDGNWWLTITDLKKHIGYWPKQLFSTLADAANQVEWGGEVHPGPQMIQLPELGYGAKANYKLGRISIIKIGVAGEDFVYVDPHPTKKVWDCEEFYTVKDAGTRKGLGRVMLYGGPWDF